MTTQLYNQQLKAAMNWIAAQDRVMILGQAVCYAGTGCYESITEVPADKKMEFPLYLGKGIQLHLFLL